eukprot:1658319-Rhodomonas_salina.1
MVLTAGRVGSTALFNLVNPPPRSLRSLPQRNLLPPKSSSHSSTSFNDISLPCPPRSLGHRD